jgi:hypothetical protein
MSKVNLTLNLKFTNTDCDKVEVCQGVNGADSGDIKKETIELAASATYNIFTGVASNKIIYIESEFDFQIDINGLGAVDVKRLLAGAKTLSASFLSKLEITSLDIINPSPTNTIKVSYILS